MPYAGRGGGGDFTIEMKFYQRIVDVDVFVQRLHEIAQEPLVVETLVRRQPEKKLIMVGNP